MAKALKHSAMTIEIKKEYLKEHLNDVKNLAETWMGELTTPPIIVWKQGQFSWGWPMIYKPSSENDPDVNNMLKRHLRSRALWSHHAHWELKMKTIWQLTEQIRNDIKKKYVKQSTEKPWHYTDDYENTALWQGFEAACGRKSSLAYKVPDSKIGLSFGAYLIEASATSTDNRGLLEKEHREFTNGIAKSQEMKDLASLLNEVAEIEEAMRAIVAKTIRSNDILYACSFCRHLWT